MTTTQIKKMSTIERLQVMEELWDALCHEEQEIKSPAWHGKILKKRKKKIESGEAEFISIDELKAGIRQ
ncbi:putative addiction module component [bacterium BMS3Abin10]|nr:putative addiction module component [bacterium BMS3Abin10]